MYAEFKGFNPTCNLISNCILKEYADVAYKAAMGGNPLITLNFNDEREGRLAPIAFDVANPLGNAFL